MVQLLDLPDEILLAILSHFAYNKPFLCQLALLSRRFSPIAQSNLMRYVNLQWTYNKPNMCKLLLRTLEDNKSLAGHVRWVRLHDRGYDEKAHDQANKLLVQLPSVQHLEIDVSDGSPKFRPPSLELNRMSSLRTVKYTFDKLSGTDFYALMSLDKVKDIEANYINFQSLSGLPKKRERRSAPLSNLTFRYDHLPMGVLHELLTWPAALRKLSCPIPGAAGKDRWNILPELVDPISPVQISQALSPVKHSLVELTLSRGTSPGHDYSRMDLSDFAELKTLTAPSECFFNYKTPSSDEIGTRLGTYRLLPRTLEDLHVSILAITATIGLSIPH
jgi:hypothetical protein